MAWNMSYATKEVLIKFVLLYIILVFNFCITVGNAEESWSTLQRVSTGLWGVNKKKAPDVPRSDVCKRNWQGGLSINNVDPQNHTPTAKRSEKVVAQG